MEADDRTEVIKISRARWLVAILAVAAFSGCRALRTPAATPQLQRTGPAAAIRFENVTARAGITWQRINGAFGQRWYPETMGGGGAFLDYDRDGFQDILLVNGDWWQGHAPPAGLRPSLALYHNRGDGTFSNVTRPAGLDIAFQGMGAAVGDYDNDGFDDIYVTGVGGSHLFHNEQGRTFKETTVAAGVGGKGWSTSAAWLDYDNDGNLDLFVCHYVRWAPSLEQFCGSAFKTYCTPTYYTGESCRLYRNMGGGRFSDATRRAGVENASSKALGVCTVDVDGDGRPDILVANDQEPNFLYRNNGDGTFSDVSYSTGFAMGESGSPRSGMGIDAAYASNDRVLSVLVGNFAFQGAALYRQEQPGAFVDRARDAGILRPSYSFVTFGVLFADLDNDMWPDAVMTNGQIDDQIERTSPEQHYRQPPLLFQNLHDGAFRNVSDEAGLGDPIPGRGIAAGDVNNDGRIDLLLVPNVGRPRLLLNKGAVGNHWVEIAIEGRRSNRDGFGAMLRVTCGGITQTAEARSGSSYCSQSDRRMHFGICAAAVVETLEIRWPSGQRDVWHGIPADRIVVAVEGERPR